MRALFCGKAFPVAQQRRQTDAVPPWESSSDTRRRGTQHRTGSWWLSTVTNLYPSAVARVNSDHLFTYSRTVSGLTWAVPASARRSFRFFVSAQSTASPSRASAWATFGPATFLVSLMEPPALLCITIIIQPALCSYQSNHLNNEHSSSREERTTSMCRFNVM